MKKSDKPLIEKMTMFYVWLWCTAIPCIFWPFALIIAANLNSIVYDPLYFVKFDLHPNFVIAAEHILWFYPGVILVFAVTILFTIKKNKTIAKFLLINEYVLIALALVFLSYVFSLVR